MRGILFSQDKEHSMPLRPVAVYCSRPILNVAEKVVKEANRRESQALASLMPKVQRRRRQKDLRRFESRKKLDEQSRG